MSISFKILNKYYKLFYCLPSTQPLALLFFEPAKVNLFLIRTSKKEKKVLIFNFFLMKSSLCEKLLRNLQHFMRVLILLRALDLEVFGKKNHSINPKQTIFRTFAKIII